MAEVAALAGVSQSTVSLVLNAVEDARIAASTRNRVLKAAERLHYRRAPLHPHSVDTHRMVGLVIDELSANWLAAALIDDVRDFCWELDADLVVASTRGQPDIEEIAVRRLLRHAPIGMIFASLFLRRVTVPAMLQSVNTILVNCYDGAEKYPAIMPDFEDAAVKSMEHLLALGHRRIAFFNHESWHVFAQRRLAGYKGALKSAGLAVDRSLIRHINGTPEQGYEAALGLLATAEPPTAILCGNDRMAFGAYDAARQLGKTIGRDVSIVGYDDHDMAKYVHPALTTVKMPHVDMARSAVERLLLEGGTPTTAQMLVAGDLVARGSTGPAPAR